MILQLLVNHEMPARGAKAIQEVKALDLFLLKYLGISLQKEGSHKVEYWITFSHDIVQGV